METINENKMINIPQITVSNVVDIVSKMLINAIKQGLSMDMVQSTMLWGAPGVGKSDAIKEIAQIIEKETDKKVYIRDVRLLMFNPIDLRGIPIANEGRTKAIWLKPDIFDFDANENVINILFLDEITAAPQSVQASAYQITLDRKIGEHRLPKNTYVICAGNRKSDNSIANQMPKALANRMMHFDILVDYNSWKLWAMKKGINDKVIGFLQYKKEYLCSGVDNKNEIAFATPRTWEMVSNVINCMGEDSTKLFTMVAGLVGVGIAGEFISFCKYYENLPDIDAIFEGRCSDVVQEIDYMYILISAMTTKAKEYILSGKSLDNAVSYAQNLTPDFSYVLHSNIVELIKMYNIELLMDDKIEAWTEKLGAKINETI